ncbi:MAG: Gfo/Idh/MocA family oxidoreductase [Spirochaetes bacterium]|nr:Gfo/Idh/MocA family oxidoreductase [Spirochaetota bacterium]
MEPVQWGILSVSKHYSLRVHPQIKGSPLVSLAGIASRDFRKAEETARQLGIAKSYGSYEELLQDPRIEAVYVPLPNHLHVEWICKAADQGKHVLCEKPLSLNAQEAEKALQYTRSKEVRLMEAFMYRFHPQWNHVKEVVHSGELGEIRFIHIAYSYTNKDPQNIRNKLEAGGGAILDIGCYAISACRFLMGKEPKRVLAFVQRDPEFKTDCLSSGILDFGSSRGVFTVSTQAFPGQRVEVVGTNGKLWLEIPFNMYGDVPARVEITTSIGQRSVFLGPAEQYRIMFEAFSRSIREGTPVPTPPEDAVANMKVIDALFRSEQRGGWEPV